MSSQRGNIRKAAPKHQNQFAFKHNPKSKKTALILSLPVEGLCKRCHDKVEWRKKYRKYKPLTKPASCNMCHKKNVFSAYHTICRECAKTKAVCCKCCMVKEIIQSEQEEQENFLENQEALDTALSGLRERERRTTMRKLQRESFEDCDEEDVGISNLL